MANEANMGIVQSAFSELWTALRTGFVDGRLILIRRWVAFLAICVVCGAADFAISVATPINNSLFAWSVGAIIITYYLLLDTLRLQEPAFKFTLGFLMRFIAVSAALLVTFLVFFLLISNVATLVAPRSLWPAIMGLDAFMELAFMSRFMFVYYLIAQEIRETNSFALSWSLTGGRMLLPTIAFGLASWAISLATDLPAKMLPSGPKTLAYLLLTVILGLILYPATLRWMQACMRALAQRQMAAFSNLTLANHSTEANP